MIQPAVGDAAHQSLGQDSRGVVIALAGDSATPRSTSPVCQVVCRTQDHRVRVGAPNGVCVRHGQAPL